MISFAECLASSRFELIVFQAGRDVSVARRRLWCRRLLGVNGVSVAPRALRRAQSHQLFVHEFLVREDPPTSVQSFGLRSGKYHGSVNDEWPGAVEGVKNSLVLLMK